MEDRESTIRSLLPMVRRIALRMHGTIGGSDLDDLIGDGCVGLIRAVDAYDSARGTTLVAYARPVIAGAMLNGIRRRDPVSERTRRTMRVAEHLRYALASERGAVPSLAEMEARLPALRRSRADAYRNAPISLDAPLPRGEWVRVDWSGDPAVIYESSHRQRAIVQAIEALPIRQRKIIAWHYFGAFSLHAIARVMAVSSQRVSQIHLRALRTLRSDESAIRS